MHETAAPDKHSGIQRINIAPPLFCLQVTQLANSLQLPTQRWNELTSTDDMPLRTALEMTCTLHNHVNTFGGLQRELPSDIEVNAVYEVLKQNRNNSCHWVGAHHKIHVHVYIQCMCVYIYPMCAVALHVECDSHNYSFPKQVTEILVP